MASPQAEWVKRRWQQLIEEFGAQCEACGQLWDLEFAHTKETGVKGRGRGKSRRLQDIIKNRKAYRLLCVECHAEFDGRGRPRKW